MSSQVVALNRTLTPSLSGFQISIAVCILTLAGLVSIFVSPLMVFVPFVGAAALWLVLRFPMTLLGLVLGFMPFGFILPYVVGRVAILTVKQEHLWARCAVWIAAVLSIAGLAEVFIFGETPR